MQQASTARKRSLPRVFDVSVAALGLIVAIPLMIAIALAVRFESPGPIFFVQERLGAGRRPFRCWKFRTMPVDADPQAWGPERDVRVTRVGRWLRTSHLDELPQLWNVLRGEMALVGPRPMPLYEAQALGVLEHARFDVRPGLTGWAQITSGCPRSQRAQREKFRLDLEYLERRSLWLDLYILAVTAVLWARRGKVHD